MHISVPCFSCCILLTHTGAGSSEKEHVYGVWQGRPGSTLLIPLNNIQTDLLLFLSPHFLLPAPPALTAGSFPILLENSLFAFHFLSAGWGVGVPHLWVLWSILPIVLCVFQTLLQVVIHWWCPPGLPAYSGCIYMHLDILSLATDAFFRIDSWQPNYSVKAFESHSLLGKWHCLSSTQQAGRGLVYLHPG